MSQDLQLRRKWTFRAHGQQIVLIKKAYESDTHVLMKALVWALFLPQYPNLAIEVAIDNRYKPDLVQMNPNKTPVFWGEVGRVGQRKMQTLVQRYRATHLVFAKWNQNLRPIHQMIQKAIKSVRRAAPIELIAFPADSQERFINGDGTIQITIKDVAHIRC